MTRAGRHVARVSSLRRDRSARRGQGGRPRAFQQRRSSFPSTRRKASNIRTSSCSRWSPANRAAYAEVCRDVAPSDLEGEELDYRRAKDKTDKSLEINKFYVNALYVAMTRADRGTGDRRDRRSAPVCSELLELKEIAEIAPTAGSGVEQGRMGAGGAQARTAGQAGAGARDPGNVSGRAADAMDALVAAGLAGMGAQGARSQKSVRQDQTGPARLCAVAWTGRLCRKARPKRISRLRCR